MKVPNKSVLARRVIEIDKCLFGTLGLAGKKVPIQFNLISGHSQDICRKKFCYIQKGLFCLPSGILKIIFCAKKEKKTNLIHLTKPLSIFQE